MCFPQMTRAERRRQLWRHFQSLGIALVEMGAAWALPDQRLPKLVAVQGLEHLKTARAAGNGALLLSAHFLSMEMGLRLLGAIQPNGAGVYRPNNNPLLDRLMQKGRAAYHGTMIARSDIRGIVRALKSNQLVWYPPDQDHGARHSVFASFFGHPAATITATARLARMSGSPVIPVYPFRRPGTEGYEVVILSPLEDFPSGDHVRDALASNRILEAQIREHIDQYLWVHRRFKTRPPGAADPYASLS